MSRAGGGWSCGSSRALCQGEQIYFLLTQLSFLQIIYNTGNICCVYYMQPLILLSFKLTEAQKTNKSRFLQPKQEASFSIVYVTSALQGEPGEPGPPGIQGPAGLPGARVSIL